MTTRQHTPDPHYMITTKLNGLVLGDFRKPISDPFVRHEVVIDSEDVQRLLNEGDGSIRVTVLIDGDRDAVMHVMNLRSVEVEEDGDIAAVQFLERGTSEFLDDSAHQDIWPVGEDAGPAQPGVDTSHPDDHGVTR